MIHSSVSYHVEYIALYFFFVFLIYIFDFYFFFKFIHSLIEYLQFDYVLVEDHLNIESKKKLLSDSGSYTAITEDEVCYSFEGLSTKLKDDSCYLSKKEKDKNLKVGDTYYILYTTQVKDSVSTGPFYYSSKEYDFDSEVKKHFASFNKLKMSKAYKKTLSTNPLLSSKKKYPDEEAPIDGLPLFEEDLFGDSQFLFILFVFIMALFGIFGLTGLLSFSPPTVAFALILMVPCILTYYQYKEKQNTHDYVVVEDTLVAIPSEDDPLIKNWTYQGFYDKFQVFHYFDYSPDVEDLVPGESYYIVFYSSIDVPIAYKKSQYDFSNAILDHLGTYDDVLDRELIPKRFYRDSPLLLDEKK